MKIKLLQKLLEKIKWRLVIDEQHRWSYIHTHKNKRINWHIFGIEEPRLEMDNDSSINEPMVIFYLDQCNIEMIDNNCVSVTAKNSNKSVFILFQNHDLVK